MFTFLHAADIHLDSPLRGLQQRDDAPVDLLRGATRRALENLVELAIDEQVAFVLLAGDIYDGDWKDYSTGLFFRRQMNRLHQAGIAVYLIAGNHDAESVISRTLSLPDNVRQYASRKAESLHHAELPVVIHGRSFPDRQVPENIAVDYPPAQPGLFNIGLLHTSLVNMPGHDTYAPCSVQDLAGKDYQYWALGHIHLPQIVSTEPWVVFSGNTQGRHIKETGPRGCCRVEVDEQLQVVSVEMRELAVVQWCELSIDLGSADTDADWQLLVHQALLDAIEGAGDVLLVARLRLHGATPLHGSLLLDQARLEAEVLAIAQDIGEESVWVQSVVIATTALHDLNAVARRDQLTASVVQALGSNDLEQLIEHALPAEITDMLALLPAELRREVEQQLDSDQRQALVAEVRELVVAALSSGGVSA